MVVIIKKNPYCNGEQNAVDGQVSSNHDGKKMSQITNRSWGMLINFVGQLPTNCWLCAKQAGFKYPYASVWVEEWPNMELLRKKLRDLNGCPKHQAKLHKVLASSFNMPGWILIPWIAWMTCSGASSWGGVMFLLLLAFCWFFTFCGLVVWIIFFIVLSLFILFFILFIIILIIF